MYRLDKENKILYFEGRELRPSSVERNFVGFCSDCDGDLFSLAYFQVGEGWMVASRCDGCGRLTLAKYDSGWSWVEDVYLEVHQSAKVEIKQSAKAEIETSSISGLSSLSREQLEAVFTSAELRDMERCERGEPYTRQNLYRARAKYEKFERLFGVRIDI